MEFVEDYKRRLKSAENMRARASSMKDIELPSTVVTTQASGAFPGMVQADWTAALGKLGLAYMNRKAGDRAAEEEKAAESVRQAGIQSILDKTSEGITPQQIIALQELGVDSKSLSSLVKKPPNEAAILQAISQGPAGIEAARSRGHLTDEQAAAALAAYNSQIDAKLARDKDLLEFEASLSPPKEPRSPTNQEMYLQLGPEEYDRYMRAGKNTPTQKTPPLSTYDARVSTKQADMDVPAADGLPAAKAMLERARQLVEEDKVTPYAKGDTLRAKRDFSSLVSGGHWNWAAYDKDAQMSLEAVSDFKINAIQALRGLGPASNMDMVAIEDTLFDMFDEPEVRSKKLRKIAHHLELGVARAEEAMARVSAARTRADQHRQQTQNMPPPSWGESAPQMSAPQPTPRGSVPPPIPAGWSRTPQGWAPPANGQPPVDILDQEIDSLMGGG